MVTSLLSSMSTVGAILGAMAVIALIEAIVPLHARGRWGRFHLLPNLALTFTTFGTNILMNAAIVMALAWMYSNRLGLLRNAAVGPTAESIIVSVLLDFAFYAVHVAMHRSAFLWRFHRVHHSDPAVDVTTTIRQHPGESVIRYAAIAAVAIPLGAKSRRICNLPSMVGAQWTGGALQYSSAGRARCSAHLGDIDSQHAQDSPFVPTA